MITTLSIKITDFFYVRNLIRNKEHKDIYSYGFALMISTLISFELTMIVSMMFHDILNGVLYFLLFAALRSYTGGYHCITYFKCNMVYLLNFLVYQWLYLLELYQTLFICSLLGMVYIWIVAPIDHENKRLNSDEKKYFGKKLRHILILLMIIEYFMIVLLLQDVLFTMNYVITMCALLAWLGKRRN